MVSEYLRTKSLANMKKLIKMELKSQCNCEYSKRASALIARNKDNLEQLFDDPIMNEEIDCANCRS